MAQFDVFSNHSSKTSKRAPYLVQVQGNYLDSTITTVVVPLLLPTSFIPAPVLNPVISFGGVEYYLGVAEITAVLRSALGRPLGSVKQHRTDIINAIDRLIQ
ncbi:CcdB family protein [Geomonas sp. Red32]|uniref:CcdB family protein n=1 Tax=Geomonas sp. Red32 TaxID=2912856 RepID=UPI003312FC4D